VAYRPPLASLIPAVRVRGEARALYPHHTEALTGRCLHHDPALQTIRHRRAQLFEALHLGGNIGRLHVAVRAALMLDLLDFDEHLVRTSFQHAVIVAAHWMTKIYRTAEGGSPEAGGLVQVRGLAVDEQGAQAGMVHDYFPPLRAHGRISWEVLPFASSSRFDTSPSGNLEKQFRSRTRDRSMSHARGSGDRRCRTCARDRLPRGRLHRNG